MRIASSYFTMQMKKALLIEQKAAIRTMAKTNKYAHTGPIMTKKGLLYIEDLCKGEILKTLILKAREHLPEEITKHFIIEETSTRSKYKLIYSGGSNNNKLYHQVLKDHLDLLPSKLTLDTICNHFKRKTIGRYQTKCLKRNCFTCKGGP